jgi:hypothetical protein
MLTAKNWRANYKRERCGDFSFYARTKQATGGSRVDRRSRRLIAWCIDCKQSCVLTILAGCSRTPQELRPVGFVNHTIHSDAQLRTMWTAAQNRLAQEIDLNPLERKVDPDISYGDASRRSAGTQYPATHLEVAKKRDVSAGLLYSATGVHALILPGSCPGRSPATSSMRRPIQATGRR